MIGIILLFLISVHLSVGMTISLVPISQKTLGEKFFRFNGAVSLVFLVVGEIGYQVFGSLDAAAKPSEKVLHWLIRINYAEPWLWSSGLLLLIYILILPYFRYPIRRMLLLLSSLCGSVALVVLALELESQAITPGLGRIIFPLDLLLSALALGSVTTCMILGHWYLVDPGMSVRPLKILAAIFITVVSARTILGGFTSLLVWQDLTNSGNDPFSNPDVGNLLFFLQRVLFGLVLPLALSWMIWQTVKIRSTQSATGILYVAVVFILFGELLSHYLLIATGYPI